ncbi:MAG: hypothetical protein H7326_06425 [Bdellovibrionaceae bacterium]|nr:hypothetical protein [Pseudobdellovibrionaceae bacterium]
MKNQTPDTKQKGTDQKNWNSSKSEKDMNDKNFSSRKSGLDDDTSRDMDLSDDDDAKDMDMASHEEFNDTEVNSPSSGKTPKKGQTETIRNAGSNSGRPTSEGSKNIDSGRDSTIGATRNDGPKGSRHQ